MKKYLIFLACLSLLFTLPLRLSAQYNAAWPQQLNSDDSAAVYALVLYPDSLRLAIFEACKYPELIVRISSLQKNTSNAFASLISGYTKTEQEDLWDLTRYPGLIDQLGERQMSTTDLNKLSVQYPAEIHDHILTYGGNYFSVVSKMAALEKSAAMEYDGLLKNYPPAASQSFNTLVAMPEIMNILNDNLSMAVLVGDMYKKDPRKLLQTADSLNLIAAQQNAANVDAWKTAIANDPNAQADLKAAAQEYAAENEVSDYTTAPSEYYVEHYVCYSYPYWFGYPYWYPYYYWYPYPMWYDYGFYIDPFGNVIVFNTPSYYFTYWYFYYPHHYYHHPYLAAVYVNYYYGPRSMTDENANIVGNWVDRNREYLPEQFFTSSTARPDVIKQLGQAETNWQSLNTVDPAHTVSRDDYMVQHQKDFPALNAPSAQQINDEKNLPQQEMPLNPPEKKPDVNTTPQNPAPPKSGNDKNDYDFNHQNKAQQYHRTVWGDQHPANQPQRRPEPTKKKPGGGK